mmetsp:Transcript_11236/g.28347  ORF Transcript_11236/g.28347 Transcript_11236/m.28347 type:complete len:287 (+) Transcript_11236:882-1742(+)
MCFRCWAEEMGVRVTIMSSFSLFSPDIFALANSRPMPPLGMLPSLVGDDRGSCFSSFSSALLFNKNQFDFSFVTGDEWLRGDLMRTSLRGEEVGDRSCEGFSTRKAGTAEIFSKPFPSSSPSAMKSMQLMTDTLGDWVPRLAKFSLIPVADRVWGILLDVGTRDGMFTVELDGLACCTRMCENEFRDDASVSTELYPTSSTCSFRLVSFGRYTGWGPHTCIRLKLDRLSMVGGSRSSLSMLHMDRRYRRFICVMNTDISSNALPSRINSSRFSKWHAITGNSVRQL